jgi:RNA polymerase sigma-70 factor, ECF subfamily
MTLAGNQGLLTRLVEEQLPDALRFAMRLTGAQQSAEEVLQEALYRAARGIGSFRGQSQFRTWFYRIVIAAFRDHLAAAARQRNVDEVSDQLPDPRGEDPASAAMTRELGEVIAARILALPPRQREVLVLTSYEQLPSRQVAEILGISESNVHANLHYARARLREELAPYLTEE